MRFARRVDLRGAGRDGPPSTGPSGTGAGSPGHSLINARRPDQRSCTAGAGDLLTQRSRRIRREGVVAGSVRQRAAVTSSVPTSASHAAKAA